VNVAAGFRDLKISEMEAGRKWSRVEKKVIKYLMTHLTKRSPRGEVYEQEAVAQESVILHMFKVDRLAVSAQCSKGQKKKKKLTGKTGTLLREYLLGCW